MLSMNPYAPSETIAALLNVNVEFAFRLDYKEKMSLDYARDYNVGGLIGMINGQCNYKNSSIPVEWTRHEARGYTQEKEIVKLNGVDREYLFEYIR